MYKHFSKQLLTSVVNIRSYILEKRGFVNVWSMKSSWRKLCFIQLFKFCIFMSANCCYHCLTNVCVIQSISLIECNSLSHTKTRIHKRVKSLACNKCSKIFTRLNVIENIRMHTGHGLEKGNVHAQCVKRYSKQEWFENHPEI